MRLANEGHEIRYISVTFPRFPQSVYANNIIEYSLWGVTEKIYGFGDLTCLRCRHCFPITITMGLNTPGLIHVHEL